MVRLTVVRSTYLNIEIATVGELDSSELIHLEYVVQYAGILVSDCNGWVIKSLVAMTSRWVPAPYNI